MNKKINFYYQKYNKKEIKLNITEFNIPLKTFISVANDLYENIGIEKK